MRRVLLLAWLASSLPALGAVLLLDRSNAAKAAFVAAAQARAEGEVVRVETVSGKNSRREPVVAFVDGDGRRVEFRSARSHDLVGVGEPRFRVGLRVPVVYVPQQPGRAEIDEPGLHEPDGATLRRASFGWLAAMALLFGGLAMWPALRGSGRP